MFRFSSIASFCLLIALAVAVNPRSVSAELPAALQAVGSDNAQVLSSSDAERVRGEWVLNYRLPLGTLYFHGAGRTTVNVETLSYGLWKGKPTRIRLTIGK